MIGLVYILFSQCQFIKTQFSRTYAACYTRHICVHHLDSYSVHKTHRQTRQHSTIERKWWSRDRTNGTDGSKHSSLGGFHVAVPVHSPVYNSMHIICIHISNQQYDKKKRRWARSSACSHVASQQANSHRHTQFPFIIMQQWKIDSDTQAPTVVCAQLFVNIRSIYVLPELACGT